MNAEEIETAVDAKLAEMHVTYTATHMGKVERSNIGDKPWPCDHWCVSFKRTSPVVSAYVTDFYTGLGHRKPVKNAPADKGFPNTLRRKQWEEHYLRPVSPKAASVLYSLVLDARACELSFHNWCEELGCSDDSISALNLYQACERLGRELLKFFGGELKTFEALLQDY